MGGGNSNKMEIMDTQAGEGNVTGTKSIIYLSNGLDLEEDHGLDLDERKRKRTGPLSKNAMDTDEGLPIINQGKNTGLSQDAVLSETDCIATSSSNLATLAR